MRTKLRGLWVLLCGVVFLGQLPHLTPTRKAWEGATVGWSPKAEVAAVGKSESWDVAGWYQDSQRKTHRDMLRVENRLRKDLDLLLATVYAWRDSEVAV